MDFHLLPADVRRLILAYIPRQLYLILADIPVIAPSISEEDIVYSKSHIMKYAARLGSIPLLQYAWKKRCPYDDYKCAKATAQAGHLKVLKWLKYKSEQLPCIITWHYRSPYNRKICDHALEAGHLNILQWIQEQNGKYLLFDYDSCLQAAKLGKLEILKWLSTLPCWPTEEEIEDHEDDFCGTILSNPIENGHLDVVRWLVDEKQLLWWFEFARWAVINGHFEMIKFLDQRRKEQWPLNVYKAAAEYGHLDILKFLCQCDIYDPKGKVWRAAIRGGQVHVLQWLKQKYRKKYSYIEETQHWNKKSYVEAAKNGKLNVLRWLCQMICPWDDEVYIIANDDIELLTWLWEHGCVLNENICCAAVQEGNLKLLQWLYQQGCQLTPRVIYTASKCNQPEILQWIQAKELDKVLQYH